MRFKKASSRGNLASGSRNSKRADRKDTHEVRVGSMEDKKIRRPIQKNRFSRMEDLANSSEHKPHEFGSLIFDFSDDPTNVKISDSTGNYDLHVSNESLKEFKMKVLLGIDQKSKPRFTIFLGECQCYPEQPEGTLPSEASIAAENSGKGEDSLHLEAQNESVTMNGRMKCIWFEPDYRRQTSSSHNCETSDDHNQTEAPTYSKSVEDSCEVFHGDRTGGNGDATKSLNDFTNLVQQKENFKGKCESATKRTMEKEKSRKQVSETKHDYQNNIEGFLKFLISDEICSMVLENDVTPVGVSATEIISAKEWTQNVGRSNEQENMVIFEENSIKPPYISKRDVGRDCPPNSIKGSSSESSLSTLRELLSTRDVGIVEPSEDGLVNGEKSEESSDFIEDMKKELIEWQETSGNTIDIKILSSRRHESFRDDDHHDVNFETEPTRKTEDLYEDATSNTSLNLPQDSLEHFFLELEEIEKVDENEETRPTVPETSGEQNLEADAFEEIKSKLASNERDCRLPELPPYAPPIPLDNTSSREIEVMWMSFVKLFETRLPKAKKMEQDLRPSTTPGTGVNSCLYTERRVQASEDQGVSYMDDNVISSKGSSLDNNVYPGQHCLPYFVEANLKRIDSVMDTRNASNVNSAALGQFEKFSFCRPQSASPFPRCFFPPRVSMINTQKHVPSHPFQRASNSVERQEKCPSRQSRIFFNPNVSSAGDWY